MVIIVAAVLSFAAITLKPFQDKNIEIEKKKDILKSVGLGLDLTGVDNKNTFYEELYAKYIVETKVINSKGEEKSGVDAFNVKMKAEMAKNEEERNLPLYFANLDDGTKKVIIPLRGKGLWGPIWGYISLEGDYNTIFGTTFDHKGETPGLGADINKDWFLEPFKGKEIFEGEELVSITIVKGGAAPGDKHGVDAISGGTITSKGLEDMLRDNLKSYKSYFKNQKN